MDKIIDFRVRPPYKSFDSEWFFGEEVLGKYQHQSGQPVAESAKKRSMELFLKEMDDNNIVHAVVTSRVSYGLQFDNMAGVNNQDVADLVMEYPDRFTGVIAIDTIDCEGALKEIDKYIVNGPCKGVTIEPAFAKGATRWDDKSLYPIYKKCEDAGAFVILTAGIQYDHLWEADPVAFDNVASAFPKLRIVICHGGWPYVTQTIWVALSRDNVWLIPAFYMYDAPGVNDFVYAINNMLSDRMMFSSAYPLAAMDASIACNKAAGIKDSVASDFFYHNAAKFLGLE